MVRALIECGITVEMQHHEVGTAGQAEIDIRFDSAAAHGRQADALQVRGQERGPGGRQDRDVHAQAAVRRQRLRHALPPEPVEGRRAAVLRRGRLRRPVRPGPLLRRRPAQARAVAAGVHQPDGELLPPAGPRLRGAGQPGLLAAQPVGLRADPDHRPEPEGQAAGVPGARPVLQPVPGVLGHADGRPGRHQEQDRAARAGGQGPVRAAAGRGAGRSRRCPARWTRCSTTSRPTTTTCSRAACSPRT